MGSKAAVLTDIHGNAPALRAVLEEIRQRGDVDQIYSLGDMVSIGPDTNEVLELLCGLPNVFMVTGNHEQYVLAAAEGREPGVTGGEVAHQKWIAERLDRKFLPMLRDLPWSLTLRHGGKTVLLRHYHPDPVRRFAATDWQPTAERLDAIYADSDADVVCFGHHHPVHLFRSGRRVYVNPGALGCCDRPVARYGLLDLSGPQVEVELREVPYERQAFLASYEALGVPEREFILKVFHGVRS